MPLDGGMRQPPSLCVVVLNWNGWRDTLACVSSLQGQDYPALSIVVVDNGSTDGSEAHLRAALPAQVMVLQSGANLGYAGGNNVGIRHALSSGFEFICLLNNDVVLQPRTFSTLVQVLDSTPTLAAVCPTIYRADGERIWWAGSVIGPRTGKPDHQYALPPGSDAQPYHAMPHLPGTCFLVRSAVVRAVGLMPEDYFLYYEDPDWSLAIRRAGWQLGWVPGTSIVHLLERSTGRDGTTIPYYYARNFLLFLRRNPDVVASVSRARRLHVLHTLYRVAWAVAHGNLAAPMAALKGLRDGRAGIVGKGATRYSIRLPLSGSAKVRDL